MYAMSSTATRTAHVTCIMYKTCLLAGTLSRDQIGDGGLYKALNATVRYTLTSVDDAEALYGVSITYPTCTDEGLFTVNGVRNSIRVIPALASVSYLYTGALPTDRRFKIHRIQKQGNASSGNNAHIEVIVDHTQHPACWNGAYVDTTPAAAGSIYVLVVQNTQQSCQAVRKWSTRKYFSKSIRLY